MGIDISRLGEAAQRQILDKLTQRQSGKYNNVKTERVMQGGKTHTFDSAKEARRYDELRQMLDAGAISDLRLQPQYTLQESYITPDGERIRAIRYVADFSYWRGDEMIVEDVKGVKTAAYKLKRKMMRDRIGITVREV